MGARLLLASRLVTVAAASAAAAAAALFLRAAATAGALFLRAAATAATTAATLFLRRRRISLCTRTYGRCPEYYLRKAPKSLRHY